MIYNSDLCFINNFKTHVQIYALLFLNRIGYLHIYAENKNLAISQGKFDRLVQSESDKLINRW